MSSLFSVHSYCRLDCFRPVLPKSAALLPLAVPLVRQTAPFRCLCTVPLSYSPHNEASATVRRHTGRVGGDLAAGLQQAGLQLLVFGSGGSRFRRGGFFILCRFLTLRLFLPRLLLFPGRVAVLCLGVILLGLSILLRGFLFLVLLGIPGRITGSLGLFGLLVGVEGLFFSLFQSSSRLSHFSPARKWV